MAKREALIRVNNSDIWLPKSQALSNASAVYAEFSGVINLPDTLTRLSLVARAGFERSFVNEYLQPDMIKQLRNSYYFRDEHAPLADSMTEKTIVAAAMIEPHVFAHGDVMGELVEPFENREIIPAMFASYRKKVAARREAWL